MSLRMMMAVGFVSLAAAACATTIITPKPDPGRSTAATLGIPPGHLPKAGECRIWIPGTPPGQQRHHRSRGCSGIARVAPSGSWIVYRPTRDKKLVHVRVVGARSAGSLIVIRVFDAGDGRFLREERVGMDESFDEEERPRGGGKKQKP